MCRIFSISLGLSGHCLLKGKGVLIGQYNPADKIVSFVDLFMAWVMISLPHFLEMFQINLVPRVLSLPPSRKYPGFGWSRVSLKQTVPHQGGLAFLQEAKGKANANLFKLARKQRNGSH